MTAKPKQIPRDYKTADTDMTIALSTIVENAIKKVDFLQTKRPGWDLKFFNGLKSDIDTVIQDHLGADNAKQLRDSSKAVYTIFDQAASNLVELRFQIEQDFRTDKIRRDEIFTELGYKAYKGYSTSKDQEKLIGLLYQCKKSLTPALKNEITAAGTDPAQLDAIIAHADALHNANVKQESFKTGRKDLTKEAITDLNAVYNKVMAVAGIAAGFYRKDPVVKDQFSYAAIIRAMNQAKPDPKKKPSQGPAI